MTPRRLVPGRVRESYLAKFAIGLVVVLLVVGSAGAYTHETVSSELHESTEAELASKASLQAAVVGEWLSEREQAARMLSAATKVQHGSGMVVTQHLVEEKKRLPPDVLAVHVVDVESQMILASSERDEVGSKMHAEDHAWRGGTLADANTNDVLLSMPHEMADTTAVAFASPVGDSGKALLVMTDVESVVDELRAGHGDMRVQVVDTTGNVYLADDPALAGTEYPGAEGETPVYELARTHGAGVVERASVPGVMEKQAVVGYAPVTGTSFALVTQVPADHAYHLLDSVQTDILLLLGVTLLGLVGMAVVFGRGTARDLDDLAERAASVAAGDLDTTIPETGRADEVGRVNDAFRDTVGYINAVADQADALARQEFEDDAFDRDVPGGLGERLAEMRVDLQDLLAEMQEAHEESEAAKQEAQALADALEAKAVEFAEVLQDAADGDLTQRVDPDSASDAMSEIARALNETLTDLETTIAQTQAFATEVSDASAEVTTGATQIAAASDQVSTAVTGISDRASEQRNSLGQVSGEMSSLSATIEEIAASADEVAQTSQRAAGRGDEASEHAVAAMEEMEEIESTVRQTVRDVESLDDEMHRISEILDLIRDVAGQTNLLALNANIEAARAGEAGDGFAVVADEIKSLAEETAAATGEIEALVEDVQSSTTGTVEGMQETSDRVERGRGVVEDALDALDDVVDAVGDADQGVQSISEATDEQATSTEETVAMVDEVASLSAESAEEADDVAAAAEEQAASVTQVTDRASNLASRAEELDRLVAGFDVRDAGDAAPDLYGRPDDDPMGEDGEAVAAGREPGDVDATDEPSPADD